MKEDEIQLLPYQRASNNRDRGESRGLEVSIVVVMLHKQHNSCRLAIVGSLLAATGFD